MTQQKLTQFSFKINVGEMEITITDSGQTHQEFVEKLAFFSSLPSKGPNGEDDLKFVARTTSKGHKYYSIVSEKAQQEFKFGQSQKEPGTMYGKGWEPLYQGDENGQSTQSALGQQNYQATQNNLETNYQPQQNYQAPQSGQLAQNPPVQNYQPQQPPLQHQPPQQPAPTTNNPAVNNVLAKYGIGQQ